MEFSSPNQQTAEPVSQGANDTTQIIFALLGNAEFLKWAKIVVPVMVAATIGVFSYALYWSNGGGWISNATMRRNVPSLIGAMPGMHFGDQAFYAKKGQTISVEVDLHEVKKGGMYIRIQPLRWKATYKDFSRLTVFKTGKSTLTRKAEASGRYKVDFLPQGEKSDNAAVRMTGGQTDLLYSATWDVK